MNPKRVCLAGGVILSLGSAILFILSWKDFISGTAIAVLCAALILFGCALTGRWVERVLFRFGLAALLLAAVDFALFPAGRFDALSIGLLVFGLIGLAYRHLERLLRPLSLALLLLGTTSSLALILLLATIATNLPHKKEQEQLPGLTEVTPEQAAAYKTWLAIIPREGNSYPELDQFREVFADKERNFPNAATDDLAEIQPLLAKAEPFLSKYWSFLSENEPASRDHHFDTTTPSFLLERQAIQMELWEIRALIDSGKTQQAESRYLRLLKGLRNEFAGAPTLVQQMIGVAQVNYALDFLVAQSDRFFLDRSALSGSLLEPQKSGLESLTAILDSIQERIGKCESQSFLAEREYFRSAIENGAPEYLVPSSNVPALITHRAGGWPFLDREDTLGFHDDLTRKVLRAAASPITELPAYEKDIEAAFSSIHTFSLKNMLGRRLALIATPSFTRAIWRSRIIQAKTAAVKVCCAYRASATTPEPMTNPLDGNKLITEVRDGLFMVNFADEKTAPNDMVNQDFAREVWLKPAPKNM